MKRRRAVALSDEALNGLVRSATDVPVRLESEDDEPVIEIRRKARSGR